MMNWIPVEQFDPPLLSSNLERLQTANPDLCAAIKETLAASGLHLRASQDTVECALHDGQEMRIIASAITIKKEKEAVHTTLRRFSPPAAASLIYLIGWGLNNAITPLFEQALKKAKFKIVLVIEPDIHHFTASLAVYSLEDAVSSKRVFWAVGLTWQEQLNRIIHREHVFAIQAQEILWGRAQDAMPPGLGTKIRQTSQTAIAASQHEFTAALQQCIQYYESKPISDCKKILAIDFKGGFAVTYIYRRFLETCQSLGLEVVYQHLSIVGGIDFLCSLIAEKPDCVVLVNLSPAMFAPIQILDCIQLPRMTWFLDDPHNFMDETTRFGKHDFLFTWDKTYIPFLQSRGAPSVDYFPYVADLDQQKASLNPAYQSPVSFIGQVKKFDPEEFGLNAPLVALVEKAGYEKFLAPQKSYASLVWDLQEECGVRILQSPDDTVPQNISSPIYIVGNALRRIHVLEHLQPFGLKLYGNEQWLDVLGEHPLKECYHGPADPIRDVPDIFLSTTININIHSLHALHSLNQRDFNCPLVGGFLLTDWVQGADEFFIPDEELVFYHSMDDLQNKVAYYLDHPDERQEIIRNGQARVQKEHTYPTRVPNILETLNTRIRDRYANPKPGPQSP
jgi:spore maturation protein CgeB